MSGHMNDALVERTAAAVKRFSGWLDRYGETSYDHQSFFASKLGRSAKALYYRKPLLGTMAVAPMIFCEAFVPSARRLFWKPQRFPIADAHYAMGFAFLARMYGEGAYYRRAVHFLDVLQETRCRGYEEYCWGYPFDWETRTGTMKEGTPLITTLPYVYEAFSQVYAIDEDQKWLRIMQSIAAHAFRSYRDIETGPEAASCGYTPNARRPGGRDQRERLSSLSSDQGRHRTFGAPVSGDGAEEISTSCSGVTKCRRLLVLFDGRRTGFCRSLSHVLCSERHSQRSSELTGWPCCQGAIERGIDYYVKNLVDANGLPLPFSKRPRLTVYRRELYDYAECINLAVLLYGRFPELDRVLSSVVTEVLSRWQRSDGSFRARQLLLGWDNVPMHRWAQSQVFRSLCFLLFRNQNQTHDSVAEYSKRQGNGSD